MQKATNTRATGPDQKTTNAKGPSLDKLLRDYHRALSRENTPTFLRNGKYFISRADKRSALMSQIRRAKKRIKITKKRTKSSRVNS